MAEKTTLERVEAGARWLAEHDHDPPGRFYLWWQAKLRPGTAPSGSHHPPDVRKRYAEWHKAFEMWLRLYAQLEQEGSS